MVRLGLMNLMMHGIDEPHIDYKDTLSKSYTEESEYDIVMANPLHRQHRQGRHQRKPATRHHQGELLFVENIYRLLKKGGTACIDSAAGCAVWRRWRFQDSPTAGGAL